MHGQQRLHCGLTQLHSHLVEPCRLSGPCIRRLCRRPRRSNTTPAAAAPDTADAHTEDAFAELVRLAVEKDPSLAPLAQQQLQKQQAQRAAAAAAAAAARPRPSSMLGPSLASLPNSSKPPWLRQRAPQGEKYTELFQQMRGLKLATVCEEAQCPNIGECWNGDMGACVCVRRRVRARACARACALLAWASCACALTHAPTASSSTHHHQTCVRSHGHHHAAGGHLHARLPLLRRQHSRRAAAARRK
jgi:hypothetical protein